MNLLPSQSVNDLVFTNSDDSALLEPIYGPAVAVSTLTTVEAAITKS